MCCGESAPEGRRAKPEEGAAAQAATWRCTAHAAGRDPDDGLGCMLQLSARLTTRAAAPCSAHTCENGVPQGRRPRLRVLPAFRWQHAELGARSTATASAKALRRRPPNLPGRIKLDESGLGLDHSVEIGGCQAPNGAARVVERQSRSSSGQEQQGEPCGPHCGLEAIGKGGARTIVGDELNQECEAHLTAACLAAPPPLEFGLYPADD